PRAGRADLRALLPAARRAGRLAGGGAGRPHRRGRPALTRSPARPGREVLGRELLRSASGAMTGSLAGLLLLNALYAVIGFQLLPLLRIARTREQLWSRLGLAYVAGTAFVGVLATYLALVGVPVGLLEVTVLALIGAALSWRAIRGLPRQAAAETPSRR